MHRIAHHNAHHSKSPAKTRQRAQVLPAVVTPLQRQHRLRRQPQRIRHSHSDAAIADVETEIARMSFQFSAPGFQFKAPRPGKKCPAPAIPARYNQS
jgi:hypothetical protein